MVRKEKKKKRIIKVYVPQLVVVALFAMTAIIFSKTYIVSKSELATYLLCFRPYTFDLW